MPSPLRRMGMSAIFWEILLPMDSMWSEWLVPGTVMGISRVEREEVASYPKWKVISRSVERKEEGEVLEERRMESLCAKTGWLETCRLGP